MRAITYNLVIERYATFREQVLVYTDEAGTLPFDFTGADACMQIRPKIDGGGYGSVLLELNPTNERLILGGALGYIELYIADEDSDLSPNTYYYDIKIKNIDGTVDRILEGSVVVVDGVSTC